VPGPLASPVALARGALRLAALGPLLLGCLGLDARRHGPLHDLRAQPRDRPARAMDGVRLPGHGVHADHRRHGAARHGTRRRPDQGAARLDGDQHANGGTSPRDGLVVWPSRVSLASSWTAGGQPVWTVHPLPLEPTGVELLVVDDDDAFVQLDVLAHGLGVDRDNITIKPRKRWRRYGDQRLDSRRRPPRLNPRHLELLSRRATVARREMRRDGAQPQRAGRMVRRAIRRALRLRPRTGPSADRGPRPCRR